MSSRIEIFYLHLYDLFVALCDLSLHIKLLIVVVLLVSFFLTFADFQVDRSRRNAANERRIRRGD